MIRTCLNSAGPLLSSPDHDDHEDGRQLARTAAPMIRSTMVLRSETHVLSISDKQTPTT
jgi:hypothetical protein